MSPDLSASLRGPLLAAATTRLAIAGAAVLALWAAVLWASLTEPTQSTGEPSAPPPSSLRLVAAAGQAAPGGGAFDRFDVASQPIVAPANAHGQVAFFAQVIHAKAAEGIFRAGASRIAKAAALGDPVPGGGTLSEFAKHPVPSLNDAGRIAFGAAVAGARASEGVFLATEGGLKAVALSGSEAPGIPTGTFAEFDAPAVNDRDEVVFLATVRRGRETLPSIYLLSNGKLRKLVAAGDPVPGGGTLAEFGAPAINNKGVIAFPAVIERGPVLGGIFIAGTRTLTRVVGVGETSPGGAMLMRLSERVAINDADNIAFGAHLGGGQAEGVFLAGADGLVQVAAVGDDAPGGGRYAGFSAWPSLGPDDTVAFMASIDDGPGPIALIVWRQGGARRIAMAGDRLPDGSALGFPLYPVTAASPNGGVTFASVAHPDVGRNGIYYFGPPPTAD
jgi:hypothetical protein